MGHWRIAKGLAAKLAALRLRAIPDRHQTEVQQQPDGNGEDHDGDQSFPGPFQIAGLEGEDRDHEVIAESCVAEKRTVLRKLSADSADERRRAEAEHEESDEQVDRQHGAQFDPWRSDPLRFEVRIEPLRAGPKKAEAALNRGAIVRLRGRHFVQDQSEVERYDPPDPFHVLEWLSN